MSKAEITYEYHHIGVPTDKQRKNERYSSTFKMYTTDGNNDFRIQWHRFAAGCPLQPIIQKLPHLAFKVDSIDKAIRNKVVLLEPYYPFDGYRVAIIEEDGLPVELIETTLSEKEIWSDSHKNTLIYPNDNE